MEAGKADPSRQSFTLGSEIGLNLDTLARFDEECKVWYERVPRERGDLRILKGFKDLQEFGYIFVHVSRKPLAK